MTRPLLVFFATNWSEAPARFAPVLSAKEAEHLYEVFLLDLLNRFAGGRPSAAWVAVAEQEEWSSFERFVPRTAELWLQVHGTEGKRLARLFEQAFERGFGPVAVVRWDAPLAPEKTVEGWLNPNITNEAAPALSLGADRSGSWWGLSLTKPAPGLFENLYSREDYNDRLELNILTIVNAAKRHSMPIAKGPVCSRAAAAEDLSELATSLQNPDARALAPKTTITLERLGFLAGS